MQTANQGTPPTRGSNGKSSLTEAAERAMALRMQAASRASQNSTSAANSTASSGRPSVIMSELSSPGRAAEEPPNNQAGNFYSAPVFPGQMSSNHATPYHAAAQQFQQNTQEDFVDGSNQGGGEVAGPYASPQKGLPGFADFRRQLGFSNNQAYSEYPESMSAAGQYASANQMPAMSGNYSASGMMPPASGFLPNDGKEMAGGYDASASMPVYPDMKISVFPGMSSQGQGNMPVGGQGLNQAGDMQPQQFDPMLQFQPLGS